MKRIVLLLVIVPLIAVSCGPLSYVMDVEMRGRSKSGLDLSRKTFSIVYVDNGNRPDSLFAASVCDGLAERLEAEYFAGERLIDIYRLGGTPDAKYSSKDTLLNLLMDTGSDVVFLLESPVLGDAEAGKPVRVNSSRVSADSAYVAEVSLPFSIKVNVFDSMDPADSVFSFAGANIAKPVAYTNGKENDNVLIAKALSAIGEQGKDVGRIAGGSFVSTWVSESYEVVYYESEKWLNAVYAANDYRWKDALDIWLTLLDTGNIEKRSCAEYNISLACYMLGQYGLAAEWLDRSDKDHPISPSRYLRQRINNVSRK